MHSELWSQSGLLFAAIISWLMLAIVLSLRLLPPSISDYELARRAALHDASASRLLERSRLLPRLVLSRQIVSLLLVVILTAALIIAYGWLGLLGSFVVVMAAIWLSVRNTAWKLVKKSYYRYEPMLLSKARQADWMDRWQGPRLRDRVPVSSQEEFVHIADTATAILSPSQRARIKAALEFGDRKVHDAMTPRTLVSTIAYDEALGPLAIDDLHRSGHRWFPVMHGTRVVGVLNLDELTDLRRPKPSVGEAMDKEVIIVRSNDSLLSAARKLSQSHRSLLIVIGDDQTMVGIVTLGDILRVLHL